MSFNDFTAWTKENQIEFKLKAIGGCMVDMISFVVDGKEVYTADYDVDTNFKEIKDKLIEIINKH